MPLNGYTAMFEAMLDHPLIESGWGPISATSRIRRSSLQSTSAYTGPIDEHFDFWFGKLPYRSLRFDHQTLDQEQFQPVAVVNYPCEEIPFTRISEYKHPPATISGDNRHLRISVEGGRSLLSDPEAGKSELFKRYEAIADATDNVTFVGARDLSLLQHGPDRRTGAGDLPADRQRQSVASGAEETAVAAE
jgi:UDP-galactopyranose mutase